ncbi:MAG: hypothetical protein ABW128_05805 [Rhizorhabdus sp.]
MFAGLYAVGEPETTAEDRPVAIRGGIDPAGSVDHYSTEQLDLLAAYEGRLYIEWGGGSSGILARLPESHPRSQTG